mgnify:CR=1 FL=1
MASVGRHRAGDDPRQRLPTARRRADRCAHYPRGAVGHCDGRGAAGRCREGEGLPRIYAADVSIGVSRFKGVYRVTATFTEETPHERITLVGGAKGPFGNSHGEGWIAFEPIPGGVRVHYTYALLIKGIVAKVGGRLLDAAADVLIAKFFSRLAKAVAKDDAAEGSQ